MSIRLRLSLWYTSLLGAVLIFFSLVLYLNMEEHAYSGVDRSLVDTARHLAETVKSESAATTSHASAALLTVDEFSAPGVFLQVVDGDGHPLVRSYNLGDREFPTNRPALEMALAGQPNFAVVSVGPERVKVYSMPFPSHGLPKSVLQVGASLHNVETSQARLRLLLLLGGTAALAVAGLVGWAMAGGALQPIAEITQTARAIALSRGFGRRLPTYQLHDEVGQLTVAFNEMLESLQEAYATQRRFVADASHELRTPLATIQGNLELLQKVTDMPAEERGEVMMDVEAEIKRLSRLVSDLLTLARADAGQAWELKRVELGVPVLEAYRQAQVMARGVELAVEQLERVVVEGDPDRLKQLALILLDNALRYTPRGRVSLSLGRAGNEALLQVADTGIGIGPEDLPHIFERFYRADKARVRDEGGTGLGLAIAHSIVQEHGGEITVDSTPGRGSIFMVRLPLVPQD